MLSLSPSFAANTHTLKPNNPYNLFLITSPSFTNPSSFKKPPPPPQQQVYQPFRLPPSARTPPFAPLLPPSRKPLTSPASNRTISSSPRRSAIPSLSPRPSPTSSPPSRSTALSFYTRSDLHPPSRSHRNPSEQWSSGLE